jgi:hypothetical protein
MSDTVHPLCYRCEHRARCRETNGKWRPRWECGSDKAVVGCYMYKPVAPVVLARDEGDVRPLFGPAAVAARMHGLRVDEGEYDVIQVDGGIVAFWLPGKKESAQ